MGHTSGQQGQLTRRRRVPAGGSGGSPRGGGALRALCTCALAAPSGGQDGLVPSLCVLSECLTLSPESKQAELRREGLGKGRVTAARGLARRSAGRPARLRPLFLVLRSPCSRSQVCRSDNKM